jgi:hypothetical protein
MSDAYDSDAGSNASEAEEVPAMISDGRRMRPVWKPGDGDGDPSAHLVERSMYLIQGHPTWKVFMGDVELPIVRGSEKEPPHYVYLDDKACHDIYCSEAYSHAELRDFYPWDFNHQGNIKQGRLNRGRPAYLDDSNTVIAQGKLRGRGKLYTFSGAPEVTDYTPLRPKKGSKAQAAVAKELADEEEDEAEDLEAMFRAYTGKDLGSIMPSEVKAREADKQKAAPRGTRKAAPSKSASLAQSPLDGAARGSRPRTHKPDGTKQGRILAPSMEGTPYEDGDSPPPARHRKSPVTPGSLGRHTPKRPVTKDSSASPISDEPYHGSPFKGRFVSPIQVEATPLKKRAQKPRFPARRKSPNFGGDGAQDDDDDYEYQFVDPNGAPLGHWTQARAQTEAVATGPRKSKGQPLEVQLQHVRAHLQDTVRNHLYLPVFGRTNTNQQISLDRVTKERDHFREVIVMLLANKISQRKDLTARVVAFQELCDCLDSLKLNVQAISDAATKQIEPSKALSEGLGTVLDQPGKYLYSKGMGEEWKQLNEDARKLLERESAIHRRS